VAAPGALGWWRPRRVLVAAVSGLVGLIVLNALLGESDRAEVSTTGPATTTAPPVAAKSTSTVRDDLVTTRPDATGAATSALPEGWTSGPPASSPASAPTPVEASAAEAAPTVPSAAPPSGSAAAAPTSLPTVAPTGPPTTVPAPEHHAVNTLCRDGSAMTGTTFDCAANGGVARLLTDAPEDVATFDAAPWARTDGGGGASSVEGTWAVAGCGSDAYLDRAGECVPRPVMAPSAPPGATAVCRDGTASFSRSRSGTCSGHGGVARWL
jgi:hypothetical protein